MPVDKDRNRILLVLRDQPEGLPIRELADALNMAVDVIERHLQYCTDYGLSTWKKRMPPAAPSSPIEGWTT